MGRNVLYPSILIGMLYNPRPFFCTITHHRFTGPQQQIAKYAGRVWDEIEKRKNLVLFYSDLVKDWLCAVRKIYRR